LAMQHRHRSANPSHWSTVADRSSADGWNASRLQRRDRTIIGEILGSLASCQLFTPYLFESASTQLGRLGCPSFSLSLPLTASSLLQCNALSTSSARSSVRRARASIVLAASSRVAMPSRSSVRRLLIERFPPYLVDSNEGPVALLPPPRDNNNIYDVLIFIVNSRFVCLAWQ